MSVKKANNGELSIEASKGLEDVKTKVQYHLWEEQQGYLFTVVAASGVLDSAILTQAITRNVRTCRHDVKGKPQAETL